MNRLFLRLSVCLIAVALAGCGATRTAAPVRESGKSIAGSAIRKPFPALAAGQYRVQPGDTLFKIAFENSLDYRALAEWNDLSDPDRIRAGEILKLVAPKPVVTTSAVPATTRIEVRPIRAEIVTPPDSRDDPPDVWVWPSQGALHARFGEGTGKGIDISGRKGQAVQAAAAGKVVYAGAGLRGYGKLIIIRHGKTLLSAYAHNQRILVGEGQYVTRGQTIAEMGDTDTDRVKLHFEIREYGKPVDPLNYLPKSS